jgi:hypothetical protein
MGIFGSFLKLVFWWSTLSLLVPLMQLGRALVLVQKRPGKLVEV